MSLSMALTRGLLRLTPTRTATPETLRRALAARRPPAPVTRAVRRVARVEQFTVNGRTVIRLIPRANPEWNEATSSSSNRLSTSQAAHSATPQPPPPGAHLLYTHGGAYVSPILATHWNLLAGLIRRSGVSVTVPLYGLAPEHHVDEAYALLDAVYEQAQAATGGRMFVGGDSAGGALALGQAMRRRDEGRPLPAGVLLISPWLDATLGNPEVPTLERRDPMLGAGGLAEAARWWAAGRSTQDPLVSPLFGSLAGLPTVFTYQGDRDLLVADTKLLTKGIAESGGRAELRIYRGAFHVFVGAPWTPEARRALNHMGAVLRDAA